MAGENTTIPRSSATASNSTWLARLKEGRPLSAFVNVVTGEWFLSERTPNGGVVVIMRSVWVTALMVLAGFGVHTATLDGLFAFFANPPTSWSDVPVGWLCSDIWRFILTHVDRVGWVFAGTYAALYARFSSQWSYLADLYNQIKAKQVDVAQHDATFTPYDRNRMRIRGVRTAEEVLAEWQAGFIEDAFELHLAGKRLFRNVIIKWATRPEVNSHLVHDLRDHKERLAAINRWIDEARQQRDTVS